MTAGKAAFHGLALSLRRAFSKGFQFDFNYTWSHSIDNGSVAESGAGEQGAATQRTGTGSGDGADGFQCPDSG
jgi:hypothetical protein